MFKKNAQTHINTHTHKDILETAGESEFGSISTEKSEWSDSAGSIPPLLFHCC